MAQPTTISIIIPTLNEARQIGGLVESILKQTLPPLEIIVVDGGSSDKTVKQAAKATKIVTVTPPNVASQRNYGGKIARGEYLFFLDADVTVKPTFLADSLKACQKRNLDVACPRYWPYGSNWFIKALHTGYNFTFWATQKITPTGGGSCIIVRRSVFAKTVGFLPDFTFEDMKFLLDASQHGTFGVINSTIGVSDRRFKRDGTMKTALLYAFISPLLLLRCYKPTQIIKYRYDHYK